LEILDQAHVSLAVERRIEKLGFFSANQIQTLWTWFLRPSPWRILSESCIRSVTDFQYAMSKVVFEEEHRQQWRDRGVMSAVWKRLFLVFDNRRRGFIDFEDYVSGVALLLKSKLEERLNLCFRFCDRLGRCLITHEDLLRAVQSLDLMYNGERPDSQESTLFCQMAFEKFQSSTPPNTLPITLPMTGVGELVSEEGLKFGDFCQIIILHPLVVKFFRLDDSLSYSNVLDK